MSINSIASVGVGASPAPDAVNASQGGRQVAKEAPAVAVKQAEPSSARQVSQAAVDKVELKKSVEAINRFLEPNSQVQFSIDNDSGRSLVKIVDNETHKVLRQFPSVEALAIAKDLGKLQGLLINSKA